MLSESLVAVISQTLLQDQNGMVPVVAARRKSCSAPRRSAT